MEQTGDPRPYILSPPRVGLGAAAPARHDDGNDWAVVGGTRLAALLWPSTSAAGPGSTALPGFVPLYSEVLPHADQEVRLTAPDDDTDPDTAAGGADGSGYDWPGAGVRVGGGDGDYDLPDDDPQVGADWAALAASTADTDHADGTCSWVDCFVCVPHERP
jgi:hypothetical protein